MLDFICECITIIICMKISPLLISKNVYRITVQKKIGQALISGREKFQMKIEFLKLIWLNWNKNAIILRIILYVVFAWLLPANTFFSMCCYFYFNPFLLHVSLLNNNYSFIFMALFDIIIIVISFLEFSYFGWFDPMISLFFRSIVQSYTTLHKWVYCAIFTLSPIPCFAYIFHCFSVFLS